MRCPRRAPILECIRDIFESFGAQTGSRYSNLNTLVSAPQQRLPAWPVWNSESVRPPYLTGVDLS